MRYSNGGYPRRDNKGGYKGGNKGKTTLKSSSTEFFINPYNFVSLGNTPSRNIDAEEEASEKLHTGYFECKLTAVTPLAIPDVSLALETLKKSPQIKEGHYEYPFYQQEGKYTIPGSSLRGVIRSVYETATNSCMVTMNPDARITTRSELGAFKPGVLKNENGTWVLYSAKRIPIVGDKGSGYKEISGPYAKYKVIIKAGQKRLIDDDGKELLWGDEVEVTSNGPGHVKREREVWNRCSVDKIKAGKGTDCYLYIGEKIFNKHAESVFSVGKKEDFSAEEIKNAMAGLEDIYDIYNSKSINRNLGEKHYGYKGYKELKRKGIIPLWYNVSDGILYLSLAAIGRISYKNTMKELTKGHKPCTDRKKLCPACSIWGMVGKVNGKGIGSKIRITDALCCSEECKGDYVTLKELGSPRTSYVPFYSTKGKKYDEIGATIRGRKFYWHNPAVLDDETIYSTDKANNRNGTYELLKAGSEFSFKVYYEMLTQEQVDMLAWSLSLKRKNDDNTLMHKIGHGKPLGLGSVAVSIEKQYERETDEGYLMKEIAYEDVDNLQLADSSAIKQLNIIMNYNSDSKDNICYPYVVANDSVQQKIALNKSKGIEIKDNVMASHKWFGEYKKKGKIMPDIYNCRERQLPAAELTEVSDRDFKNLGNSKPRDKNYKRR